MHLGDMAGRRSRPPPPSSGASGSSRSEPGRREQKLASILPFMAKLATEVGVAMSRVAFIDCVVGPLVTASSKSSPSSPSARPAQAESRPLGRPRRGASVAQEAKEAEARRAARPPRRLPIGGGLTPAARGARRATRARAAAAAPTTPKDHGPSSPPFHIKLRARSRKAAAAAPATGEWRRLLSDVLHRARVLGPVDRRDGRRDLVSRCCIVAESASKTTESFFFSSFDRLRTDSSRRRGGMAAARGAERRRDGRRTRDGAWRERVELEHKFGVRDLVDGPARDLRGRVVGAMAPADDTSTSTPFEVEVGRGAMAGAEGRESAAAGAEGLEGRRGAPEREDIAHVDLLHMDARAGRIGGVDVSGAPPRHRWSTARRRSRACCRPC